MDYISTDTKTTYLGQEQTEHEHSVLVTDLQKKLLQLHVILLFAYTRRRQPTASPTITIMELNLVFLVRITVTVLRHLKVVQRSKPQKWRGRINFFVISRKIVRCNDSDLSD